jgi:acylphosphatase
MTVARPDVTAANDLARLRIIVSGRVQDVFFRAATADEARWLGIQGFARNRPDGTVEIVAEGSRKQLEALLAWAHTGPPHSRVDEVAAEWAKFQGDFNDFRAR